MKECKHSWTLMNSTVIHDQNWMWVVVDWVVRIHEVSQLIDEWIEQRHIEGTLDDWNMEHPIHCQCRKHWITGQFSLGKKGSGGVGSPITPHEETFDNSTPSNQSPSLSLHKNPLVKTWLINEDCLFRLKVTRPYVPSSLTVFICFSCSFGDLHDKSNLLQHQSERNILSFSASQLPVVHGIW